MLKPRGIPREHFKRPESNLFKAALDNDVNHMNRALKEGKRLSEIDPRNGFTPLHVAALNGSADFVQEALKDATAEPWLRDMAGHLAIDHSDAQNHKDVSALFFEAMFPNGQAPLTSS